MGNKSIGETLNKVCSYQKQQVVLSDWAKNWKDDQKNTIAKLRLAIQHGNYGDVMHMLSQLDGLTEKRFTALNNVLAKLSDPDRNLVDLRLEPEDEAPKTMKPEPEAPPVRKKESKSDFISDFISEIVKGYKCGMSVKEMSALNGVNEHKIVKILVTYGVFTSDIYDKIKEMRLTGHSEKDIAFKLGLSASAMNDYTPYCKGMYGMENKSENAKNIERHGKKCKDSTSS